MPVSRPSSSTLQILQQSAPDAESTKWEYLISQYKTISAISPLFDNCNVAKVVITIRQMLYGTCPDSEVPNQIIPKAIWDMCMLYQESPIQIEMPKNIIGANRFRPTSFGWVQPVEVTKKLFAEYRTILYSGDAEKMHVYRNRRGGNRLFGVKTNMIFRTSPLVKISQKGQTIKGYFAVTLMLPWNHIPRKYRVTFDPDNSSTWKYKTTAALQFWAFGVWFKTSDGEELHPNNQLFVSHSIDQFACIHNLTNDPISPCSTPVSNQTKPQTIKGPVVHLSQFKDKSGRPLKLSHWYPSLSLNYLEVQFTSTYLSTMEIVRSQVIPPQNVFKELLRVADPIEIPPCKKCGIRRMCGETCTGAEEEAYDILQKVTSSLDREGMSSEIKKMTLESYMFFIKKMRNKNGTYIMSANEFVDALQMFYKFPSYVLPIIGTVSFPIATDIRKYNDFKFAKSSRKRTRNTFDKVDTKRNNKESSSEWSSEDDNDGFEIQIIKKRKMNNGQCCKMK